jgi:hypothetical protein
MLLLLFLICDVSLGFWDLIIMFVGVSRCAFCVVIVVYDQDRLLYIMVGFFLVVYLCEWAWFLLVWFEDISVMFLLLLLLLDMYFLEGLMFWAYLFIVSGYFLLLFVCVGVSICLFWPRPGGRGSLEVVVVVFSFCWEIFGLVCFCLGFMFVLFVFWFVVCLGVIMWCIQVGLVWVGIFFFFLSLCE